MSWFSVRCGGLLSCLYTVSARTELLCVSTVSLLANQDILLLLAPLAVIGPPARHSCSWFVSASCSLPSESLVSSSLLRFSSIGVEWDCKFLSRGHSQRSWKCFEVESLSELNTHPPSISLRFLVWFLSERWRLFFCQKCILILFAF